MLQNYSIRVAKTLICAFGFAYADCWFSHEVAHISVYFDSFYKAFES